MSFWRWLALIAGHAAMRPGWFFLAPRKKHAAASGLEPYLALFFITSLLARRRFHAVYQVFQFQQIQPYWILADLVAVPLTALWVLPLGLLALALMPFLRRGISRI